MWAKQGPGAADSSLTCVVEGQNIAIRCGAVTHTAVPRIANHEGQSAVIEVSWLKERVGDKREREGIECEYTAAHRGLTASIWCAGSATCTTTGHEVRGSMAGCPLQCQAFGRDWRSALSRRGVDLPRLQATAVSSVMAKVFGQMRVPSY